LHIKSSGSQQKNKITLQFIYLHIFPLIIQVLMTKEQQLHVDSAAHGQ